MNCENCNNQNAKRLYWGAAGKHCNECRPKQGGAYTKPNLHFRGVNSADPKMTYADQQHIKSRHIGKDGMVHAAPRWETKDF